jgi:hypothetical protein
MAVRRMGHPTHLLITPTQLLMALTWDRPPAPTRPCGHNYPLNTYKDGGKPEAG